MMKQASVQPNIESSLPHKAVRYESLDMWRGLGCLLVVMNHSVAYSMENAQSWANGDVVANALMKMLLYCFVAVPVFFVISGYGLAAATLSMHGRSKPVSTFFKRRIRRVYPPAWAVILLTALATACFAWMGYKHLFQDETLPIPSAGHDLTLWQWIGNLTLTEMWLGHFTAGGEVNLMVSPLWSICYEEQFYLLVGLSLFFARKWFFKFIIALSLITMVLMPLQYMDPKLPIRGFFFDGQWLLFAAGVLVYYRAAFASTKGRWICNSILIGAALLCLFARLALELASVQAWMMTWIHDGTTFSNVQHRLAHFFAGFMAALVMSLLLERDGWIMTRPWLQWLKVCGTFSYSIYLVHWPVTKLAGNLLHKSGVEGHWMTMLISIPVCMTLSLSLAWVFFHLVEKRFMNRPHNTTTVKEGAGGSSLGHLTEPGLSAGPAPVLLNKQSGL